MSAQVLPIGAVKFILVHHSACPRGGFHYRICQNGSTEVLLSDQHRGQHPNSIGIVVEGDFDARNLADLQLDALKELLLQLKLKYPAATVGAHRQIRGDKNSSCPGQLFPLRELIRWSRTDLLNERDAYITADIESQYGP